MKISGDYPWQCWCYPENPLPPEIVTYEASMTRRLAELSGEKPLILKRTELVSAAADRDCRFLEQPSTSWLWQREILLGHGSPWLFGYTLTLPTACSKSLWDLHRVGTRPLGEKLFTVDGVYREFFDIGQIGPPHQLWQRVRAMKRDIPDRLWARCSVFNYQGNPLLLYEVLFPECPGLEEIL